MIFTQEQASTYNDRYERLAPLKDVLHLCAARVLEPLPPQARVLVVGAGTGNELLYLAEHFPAWQFTVVEPSEPMLAVCRERVEQAGIAGRTTLVHGFLEDVAVEPHHGATSFLVSHFLTERDRRLGFFRAIAARLHPGGVLVNADLTHGGEDHEQVMDLWFRTLSYSFPESFQVDNYLEHFNREVSLLADDEIRRLLVEAGFRQPTLFLKTLMINAWFARL
ncbi:MAG: class I SAM-dependent methyltransferase [Vulcanimicrobiota bacterium]